MVEKKSNGNTLDPELAAMKKITRLLAALRPDQQERVIAWASSKATSSRQLVSPANLAASAHQ